VEPISGVTPRISLFLITVTRPCEVDPFKINTEQNLKHPKNLQKLVNPCLLTRSTSQPQLYFFLRKSYETNFLSTSFQLIFALSNHHTMLSSDQFPRLLLAGKATLTLRNPARGTHIRVQMRNRKDKAGNSSSCYFLKISLLGDGDAGYKYAGAYFSDSKKFKPSPDLASDLLLAPVVNLILRAIDAPQILNSAEILHEGKCCRCGRKLTHPESIETGLGPECGGRV
jgi:hypothetical protein